MAIAGPPPVDGGAPGPRRTRTAKARHATAVLAAMKLAWARHEHWPCRRNADDTRRAGFDIPVRPPRTLWDLEIRSWCDPRARRRSSSLPGAPGTVDVSCPPDAIARDLCDRGVYAGSCLARPPFRLP